MLVLVQNPVKYQPLGAFWSLLVLNPSLWWIVPRSPSLYVKFATLCGEYAWEGQIYSLESMHDSKVLCMYVDLNGLGEQLEDEEELDEWDEQLVESDEVGHELGELEEQLGELDEDCLVLGESVLGLGESCRETPNPSS